MTGKLWEPSGGQAPMVFYFDFLVKGWTGTDDHTGAFHIYSVLALLDAELFPQSPI